MKMRNLLAVASLAAIALSTPAMGQSTNLPQQAKAIVADMEASTGRMIVVLERSDTDLSAFFYKATTAMCEKTGDDWCEDQVMTLLSDTTNPLGWARVITYKNKEGIEKTVCALLPPKPNVNAGYAATGLTGGVVVNMQMLPTASEMEAYLWLLHTAGCQSTDSSDLERRRSNVFAVMALTLIQGDTAFVGAYDPTPARKFVAFRDPTQTRWGVNVGERILLEQWKSETAEALVAQGCAITASASSDLNTDFIERDSSIDDSECSGSVTDSNLWLWSTERGGSLVSLPPKPYQPFKMFASRKEGVDYMWQTSEQLAR